MISRLTRTGFTLIELLVVIAIIAVLAAILFPVFSQARESARISAGLSNIKQINLGIAQYIQDYDETLPLGGQGELYGGPGIGQSEWQEAIYPYVKNEGVYRDPDDQTQQDDTADVRTTDTLNGIEHYGATSFLMDGVITQPTNTERVSRPLAAFAKPASFILLMNGMRYTFADFATDARYGPDHNGRNYSLWLAEYTQQVAGGTQHLFDQCGYFSGANLPHHKRGELFAFLDGHVKFIAADLKKPDYTLEGKYPYCTSLYIPQGDMNCTRAWNHDDGLLGSTCPPNPYPDPPANPNQGG